MKIDERQSTLVEVSPALVAAYRSWKEWETAKNELKEVFFHLADAEIRHRGLAVNMINMPGADEQQARERIERHYPEWEIQELRRERSNRTDMWEAVLIENPSLKAFAYERDGTRLARTISKGSVMVDDEWLAEENPELYEQVTFTLPWGEVIPLPVDELPKELVALLTKYCYYGRPTARLAAPRGVKEGDE